VFDHVTIRVGDLVASERFYRTVLSAVGIESTHTDPAIVKWDDFSLVAADPDHPVTRHLHVGFATPSEEAVQRFWKAGVDAGYTDDGAPGPRDYSPAYYGAFLLDPDGNSAEAVTHEDTRRGGNVDHLWIGVADLDAAARFYATIARHAGLRGGRRTDDRVQFRGAWATFSLIADGRPPTEALHVAFPAPDRLTVDQFHAAGTVAGYASNGAPGERSYDPGYYSAYLRDPDGTNVESVFRERR
jgi:catechol 2,3-dioxygenase-like lactoylglutathione lyase family enzyme